MSDREPQYARAAFLLVPLGGCNRMTPVASPVPEMAQVRLLARTIYGEQFASIEVVNRGTDFICIHASFFDPEEQLVYFTDEKGRDFRTQMPGDRFPKTRRGFEYEDSYYFLGPGEDLKVSFNLEDFHLIPGRYRYHIVMPFYICRDIIDVGRIKKGQDVKHLGIGGEGDFDSKQDPARP